MINAKDVLRLVRFKQKDNNEITFSDYDIKMAMNEALTYIGQSQALQNSDFLMKTTIYNEDLVNEEIEIKNLRRGRNKVPYIDFLLDGVDLPEDYQVLAGVKRVMDGYDMRPCDAASLPHINEYKVVGNKIYSNCRCFALTYKRTIPPVKDVEKDVIDLPTFCTDLLVKLTGYVLTQAETDVLMQAVEQLTRAIIPRRRYHNAQTKMPFIC